MASLAISCPEFSPLLNSSRFGPIPHQKQLTRFVPLSPSLKFQQHGRNQSGIFKVHTHLNEFAVEKSLNSLPVPEAKVEVSSSRSQDKQGVPDALSIEIFFNQVADFVELVDSRDIIELELKQQGCEVIMRKKEALPQPQVVGPIVVSQPSIPQAIPSQQPPAQVGAAPSSSSVPSAAVAAPEAASNAKSSSSHPPLKCPMAGTFYRSPAPGAPLFVKVGDKVQKGQVVCIIEAMKLMNEIEADQSGTVVEILVGDGKPVSVDSPLLVIQP